MIAIIEAGGKQYLVTPEEKIEIEKTLDAAGDEIAFDKILLVANEDGTDVQIGAPTVSTKIAGTVLRQFRTKKIIVRKFKNKVRYHRTAGHRQHKTEIKIGAIA